MLTLRLKWNSFSQKLLSFAKPLSSLPLISLSHFLSLSFFLFLPLYIWGPSFSFYVCALPLLLSLFLFPSLINSLSPTFSYWSLSHSLFPFFYLKLNTKACCRWWKGNKEVKKLLSKLQITKCVSDEIQIWLSCRKKT